MHTAGLPEIVEICRSFGFGTIDKQLAILEKYTKEDNDYLREKYSQERLQDHDNSEDVYNVISQRVRDSKASRHFLSMMQHLLLVEDEGPQLDHMYEILDSAVTDIVMDNKLGRAEGRIGTSVQRLIAQLNEKERLQEVEEEAAESRAQLVQLRLMNNALQEEVAQGAGGLVGQLKQQIAVLEEKLRAARETIQSLQAQLVDQRRDYEEQIRQLEAQIMELFRMLKELGVRSDQLESKEGMDRKELIATLEKQLQRNTAMQMLERRSGVPRSSAKHVPSSGDVISDTSGRSSSNVTSKSSVPIATGSRHSTPVRDSQFIDADEAAVQEHIENRLAADIDGVRTLPCKIYFDFGGLRITTVPFR
jgi:cytokinesis protein